MQQGFGSNAKHVLTASASNKMLAALFVCLDRLDDAQQAMDGFLSANDGYSREIEAEDVPADWKPAGTGQRWMEAMAQAGMP